MEPRLSSSVQASLGLTVYKNGSISFFVLASKFLVTSFFLFYPFFILFILFDISFFQNAQRAFTFIPSPGLGMQ
jgi:hypothetical protein